MMKDKEYAPLKEKDASYDIDLPEVSEPPVYSAEDSARFPTQPQYQNKWAAAIFVLHLVVLGGLFAAGFLSFNKVSGGRWDTSRIYSDEDVRTSFFICGGAAVLSSFVAIIWFYLCRKHPKVMIYFSIIGTLVLLVLSGVLNILTGNIGNGIVTLIIFGAACVGFYIVRNRIPFAALLLSHVTGVLNKYPAVFVVATVGLLIQIVLFIFYYITFFFDLFLFPSGGALVALIFFFLFSCYWTIQVLKNTVHVVASGACATDYFFSGSVNGVPPNPTLNSLKRALSYSFGPICLGSLVVALVQTLHFLLRCISCRLVDCCGSWIERIVRYFNMYAFTHVAVYGKAYCDSAKDTYDLFKNSGLEALSNDSLTGVVIFFASFLTAVISFIFGVTMSAFYAPFWWFIIGPICFSLGFAICSLPLSLLHSGICTVFVCFAEQPGVLKANNPELHRQMVETYNLTESA